MAKSFEYLTCQVQSNRVTFVDGQWTGTADRQDEQALESCPTVWDYLRQVGRDGWELVACWNETHEHASRQVLYFKRPLDW